MTIVILPSKRQHHHLVVGMNMPRMILLHVLFSLALSLMQLAADVKVDVWRMMSRFEATIEGLVAETSSSW